MKKSFLKLLPLLLTTCLSSQAQALDPTHVYEIISGPTGQALEIGGGGNLYSGGLRANTARYWGGANQQWFLIPSTTSPGYYKIVNRNSRLPLTTQNPNPAAANRDTYNGQIITQQADDNITTPDPNQANTQLWYIRDNTTYNGVPPGGVPISGTNSSFTLQLYTYVSNSNPQDMVATTDGRVFQQVDRVVLNNPPNYQTANKQWTIVDVSANSNNSIASSSFQIINDYSGKALSASPDGNTNVGQMTPWALACEEWIFSDLNSSNQVTRYLINRQTQQYLQSNGTGNGVQASVANGTLALNQQWVVQDPNDGHVLTMNEIASGAHFRISSAYAGKALENGGATNDGAAVYQWNIAGQPWQSWHAQFDSPNAKPTTGDPDAGGGTPTAVSIAKLDHTLKLYPNPAHDIISVSLPGIFAPASTVQVLDIQGRTVPVSFQNGTLKLTNLAAGIYIAVVSDGQHTYHQKFVKQ